MGRKITYCISPEFDGTKVLNFLRGKVNISYRLLRNLKNQQGGITLNGQPIRTVDIIHTNDILAIEIPCPDSDIEPINIPIDIIYEDSDIIAVNKSPFLACHPTHNHQGDTLANAIAFHLKSKGENCVFRAVGRLDKGTSGIVICALNKHAAYQIPKSAEKEYIALVRGKLPESGTIDAPIYRPDPLKTVRAVGDSGDRAVTHWTVIKQNDSSSLVRVKLETGRTHQIRVHFASIGHSLVGDSLYGTDEENIGHQLLHCASVSFIHPVTGEKITLNAPMPEDMQKEADKI
ncbi:MAG: RluA family pseudouridine synthase [Clostridia bacterium]|nr:RluA family pseudouridine synthase [Clostridia bacterium]